MTMNVKLEKNNFEGEEMLCIKACLFLSQLHMHVNNLFSLILPRLVPLPIGLIFVRLPDRHISKVSNICNFKTRL